MDYISCEFKFEQTHPWREIIIVNLCELAFESFEEEDDLLLAYIPSKLFDNEIVEKLLDEFEYKKINYSYKLIEDQNWNSNWEKNFEFIEINEQCLISAPFHNVKKQYRYHILINPQMSFGTGHHQTTSLILEYMTNLNFNNLDILDMGCGTGVLAIMASKKGAKSVKAIDIDNWSFENSKENISLNDCENVSVMLGSANLLHENEKFDVILANINRNILLNDFSTYVKSLRSGGKLLMSGFYMTDIKVLSDEACNLNLQIGEVRDKEGWAMIEFLKK